MGSVGWAAVAMIARQRNNQRGEVVAVTVRMPSQPSPLLALASAGCVARGRSPPDCAARTPLCTGAPACCVSSPPCPTWTQDGRTSPRQEPWRATSYSRLFSGPPRHTQDLLDGAVGQVWSQCPSRGLLVCTRPEAKRRPWLTRTLTAERANSLMFGVHFSHLFMHAPPPKAPPGCRVPSSSSCPHWHPPYQEEGAGWGVLAIAGACVLPQHP